MILITAAERRYELLYISLSIVCGSIANNYSLCRKDETIKYGYQCSFNCHLTYVYKSINLSVETCQFSRQIWKKQHPIRFFQCIIEGGLNFTFINPQVVLVYQIIFSSLWIYDNLVHQRQFYMCLNNYIF